ncbi:MAG: hypothetical protein DRJ42_28100 [Deltaproteobacteria bacterium]|nr:MAG: hypothetical protein DRJ42_28100 [Deltaproteobacteria bacterium]
MTYPYNITATRTDNRKGRQYSRNVEVFVRELPDGVSPYRAGETMKPRPEVHNLYSADKAAFTWSFKAAKPSEIISEEDGVKRVEAWIPALMQALVATKAAADLKVIQEAEHQSIMFFAEQVGAAARRRAEDACRYDQRLAALHAELDAEIVVQVQKVRVDQIVLTSLAETNASEFVQGEALRFADRYARRSEGLGMFDNSYRVAFGEIFGDDDETP